MSESVLHSHSGSRHLKDSQIFRIGVRKEGASGQERAPTSILKEHLRGFLSSERGIPYSSSHPCSLCFSHFFSSPEHSMLVPTSRPCPCCSLWLAWSSLRFSSSLRSQLKCRPHFVAPGTFHTSPCFIFYTTVPGAILFMCLLTYLLSSFFPM